MSKNMLSPLEVTEYVEEVGVKKAKNKSIQTLFLGILAGAYIALGAFGSAVASHSVTNFGLQKTVAGLVFPVGLLLVLICGAELFTGNCLLSVAVAQKRISIKDMAKNLLIVFIGNFIGTVLIAFLVYGAGLLDFNSGAVGGYAIKVATGKVNLTVSQALFSGILCNIIVCLAVWGSYTAKDISGKVLMGFIPIFVFIISGFEHCVANMYYLTIGLLAKGNPVYVEASHQTAEKLANLNVMGIIHNLIPVTIGNIIGGSVLIGLTYWFIYKKSEKNKEIIKENKVA
ncbi:MULTISPECIES: formate/nitrite transporter family protein [Clostridium]|uniref:Formate/nitrite transporter family protein n=1 Tax=Clostridium senegalense TaxID=1465809 RepID=A0A6M0H1M7_9CLOT|nr:MULTISPECIES: formate/nitrite transporter family protein [Clostridium]NEU04670.1 formate/nitrite transporter family protein [Clostridium senegalense]